MLDQAKTEAAKYYEADIQATKTSKSKPSFWSWLSFDGFAMA
jgi:hypothetical protein